MILLPNFFTACNLTLGCFAILSAFHGNQSAGFWAIMAAAFFDGIDGKTAAWLDCESKFGAYFDSFADLISFGLAPAFIFHSFNDGLSPLIVNFSCGVYIFCCAFRLIRFHRSEKRDAYFTGLPTTASAVCFSLLNLLNHASLNQELISLLALTVLSGLMVSRLRFFRPIGAWFGHSKLQSGRT